MATTLADRLKEQRRRHFVGRSREKALLESALQAKEWPFLLFFGHGPGGVGKTSLLREFETMARESGFATYSIDCRFVAPSPEGCELALRHATGAETEEESRKILGTQRSVLFIDTFELLHPLEGWFREDFLPRMPDTLFTVVMGRRKPSNQWFADGAWSKLAKLVGLRNLTDQEASTYLCNQDVPENRHADLLRFTHGHPLALSLVCETLAQRGDIEFDPGANPDVINLLLDRFLDTIPDPLHRRALEASAMLRNTTEALLAAIVDEERSFELFEWLKTLSFFDSGPMGIYPHDLARDAISMEQRWRNPDDLGKLHDAARSYYADHLERTAGAAQQSILADLIYLHRENPVLKPFFDFGLSSTYIDSAKPEDHGEILKTVERFEGKESAKLALMWLESDACQVQVLRSSQSTGFSGFLITVDPAGEEARRDPSTVTALNYMEKSAPLRPGERALVYRYWMSRESYQDVSADQSMLFVAMLSTSLTTPNLAHTFQICANPDFYKPMFDYAAIKRVDEAGFEVGGKRYGAFGHDWRVMPLRTWLSILSERELPTSTPPPRSSVRENDLTVLSQSSFEDALVHAFKAFNNPARLAENPLLKSKVVMDRVAPDAETKEKIVALREAIVEQARTLVASSKDAKLYQALSTSYFKPARSQEIAAEQVDVSIASYRRHLKAGVQRILELLWQVETGG